ncbi:MAG: isoprenylcysteine carboxylmethyltransferase family protein [Candidatus Aminicenantes bacterium]|nr:MAG: isoprenylcysteine carboxylmethyltransferase family protein [Candidatus Aminicenantes bacterium]
MTNNENENSKKIIQAPIWIRPVIVTLVMIIVIFLSAGRLNYWQGWVFNILFIIFLIITITALRDKPELVTERLKPGEGMKQWDKKFYLLSTLLFLVIIVLSGLDAGRYQWSPQISLYVYIFSGVIYIMGQLIFLWAKYTNSFFSSVVRIQVERGHTVCQDGPYRFIRHPGYVGTILFTLASPLLLGSLWALIPAGITFIPIVIRTHLEDRTLQEELPGYVDYTKKVRYKLIPYLW